MASIDIDTAQNVTIEYELAHLRDRILAFLLDFVIYTVGLVLLGYIFAFAFQDNIEFGMRIFGFIISPLIIFFYTPFWEIVNNGQSPGKMALGIRVVRVSGSKAEFNDYILRWSFRMIDIIGSFGTVAAIMISSSEKNQRLGGLLSNTTVVRDRKIVPLKLADIIQIQTTETYTPVYRQVTRLKEEDMLIIKQTIERYRRYRNDAHKKVIHELVQHLCEILDIPPIKKNKLNFLKTLIKDYVVLTR